MKTNNRSYLFAVLAVLLMAFAVIPGGAETVYAEGFSKDAASQEEETVREAAKGAVDSGTCGENVTWTLDENGTLTISGTGEMEDYKQSSYPFMYDDIKTVIIKNGVTSIGDWVFIYCRSMTRVEIPESVTSIGWQAFEDCSSLKSIEIPKGVTSIGNYAFYLSSLESITLSEELTSIASHMCTNCSSLKNVTIPKGVTIIDWQAFENCSSLTKITLPDTLVVIRNYLPRRYTHGRNFYAVCLI
ncbi:MAG: leucine-rich repeat domain-containing protein [Lachnospiraceae bacterium]|nr:leucine-rich repeat domain-containing protein [Lachnospiraceae bacterium]